ncbi:MAG: bifunctional UDP-N-acetylglucosamine diphosphorylase/glucosamine-1-phosphate N-acetyltransferase GlmU [Granulosicoccaceae bacterium]|jgi:bifunctional UDP-N-acetylglucosamine pyrophosphorylase/glucosamine-1-phosphate N-acetyltransferase
MPETPLYIVILAAGQGTRMRSRLPKVMHTLAGRAMLEHVSSAAGALAPAGITVVYGHGGEQVKTILPGMDVDWVEQAEQLGTGHAVAQALPSINADDGRVLVLYGDVPLIQSSTLKSLVQSNPDGIALLTVNLDDPAGYGRIVRDAAGRVAAITEHKDADTQTLAIREINTGILAAPLAQLRDWIARLDNDNAQGEYYLTDVIAMAVQDGIGVEAIQAEDEHEVSGVNDRLQLAALERYYQHMQAEQLMQRGVSLRDPARIDIRGEVSCGQDVSIDINVILEGRVSLGNNVKIGPNVIIRDCIIGDDTHIEANSLLEQSETGRGCSIGPFARLRPGARLADGAKVGNFVEVKNAEIGKGSKVNHLSYIGDATLGSDVNIGAGTITCNYDGARKHRTIIEDNAFIGSNTALVAPLTIGKGATIGAGSTINKDAPQDSLSLSRSPQKTITGWQRPVKKREE